jgi:hypothetical protein
VATPLFVDEAQTTPIGEYSVEFILTPAQVEHEAAAEAAMAHGHGASTGVTLASRAANILAQAEDMVIFQGKNALGDPLFSGSTQKVIFRSGPADTGLLQITLGVGGVAGSGPSSGNVFAVTPASTAGQPITYQYKTVNGVAQAYAGLQGKAHYGPYAMVLQTNPYADVYSPLPTTLITPAEPIKGLATAGLFGSGTLLSSARTGLPTLSSGQPVLATGVLVSIDANIVDLVRGRVHPEHDAVITFVQRDQQGNYLFRVVQRFALRLKDPSAVFLLEFTGLAP